MRPGGLRTAAAAAGAILAFVVAVPAAFADSVRDRQWHLKSLDVAAVQKVSRGTGVVVAVLDTGVKADHRDLSGSVLPGADFVATGTKGQVDTDGHGTAMAGLIAAHGHGPGGADGALGIAPGAKILPMRVLRSDGRTTGAIPEAIDLAVDRGADVISMSLGVTESAILDRALDRAMKADVVLVAATGNRPEVVFMQFPAKYPGVVAVGGTGRSGKVAPFSITGKETVLTAPGADITSTSATGGYLTGDGTSNSVAIVAGAAALIRSRYPDMPATEVVRRLTATATDKGASGRDKDYGFGELDLAEAVTADVGPSAGAKPAATSPPGGVATEPAKPVVAEPATSSVRVDWAVIGVVLAIGALVVVLIIVLIGWWLVRRRRRSAPPPGPGGYRPPPEQRAGESRRDTFRP